jgi:hypothetical protein
MSFEEAVNLFKDWGFRVEPGPEPEEVTLWIDALDHHTCCVYPAHLLPEIANVIQQVRTRKQDTIRIHCIERNRLYGFDTLLIRSLN